MSLCTLLSPTICPLSVTNWHSTVYQFCITMYTAVSYSLSTVHSTSHWTLCCFCATVTTALFYSLSTVSQYLTIYRLLFLFHYVHCCLPNSVQILSLPHKVPYVVSVSLYPLLSSTDCPVSELITLYRLLFPWHCIHCILLQIFHCLAVPQIEASAFSGSLYPLLSSTVCPLYHNISKCSVCGFCVTMYIAVFYSLSTVCH